MRRSAMAVVASLMLVWYVCGCGPYRGTKAEPPPLESYENLVYLDSALTTAIPCEDLSAESLPSGRLRVYVSFYNRQNHTAECQVMLKFKDAGGRIIDETSWMPLLLPRRQSTQFEHTSLSNKAKGFVLMLRKAKT
ncbi:MAG: hypothetical protein GWP08_15465 [Nitrospiraceae bacterium]|nr:hypothetical protein [Nitrospiraceae bacterium]